MKKLIIIITVILLLLIAPFYVGSQTETHFKKLVELSNQNPSYEIKIIEYERGLFTSTAKVEFSLLMDLGPELENLPAITFIQHMQHGPVLYKTQKLGFGLMDSSITVELPEDWQQSIDTIASINPQTLQLTSRTAFDESTSSFLTMAAFQIEEDNSSINILPAKANLTIDMTGHISGNFQWQGMEVTEASRKLLEIGQLNAELDEQLVRGELFAANSIFTGTFNSTIKQIQITPKIANAIVELTDLSLHSKTELRADLLDVNLVYGIAGIKAMGLEFTNFINDISILNLDVNALQEFAEQIVKMQENGQQYSDPAFLLNALQSLIPNMLAAKPLLKINQLGLSTTNGPISSQLEMFINEDLYITDDPDSLLQAIVVDASGHGPEAFFTALGLAGPIDHFVQQNMLIREQPLLKFTFTFVNGQALLNGAPIPLAGM